MKSVRYWAQKALILASYASLLACSNAKTTVDFLKSLTGDSLFPGVVLKINGATSATSNNATPTLEVSGFSDSTKVEIFTSSTCDAAAKAGEITVTSSATTVSLSAAPLVSEGTYEYYGIVTSSLGVTSDCSKNKVIYTYDTTPPSVPSGVNLLTTVHSDATPDFQVTGLEMNASVYLYADPSCSSIVMASAQATGTNMNLTSAAISEGTYQYYAKTIDLAGNPSACSTGYAQYIYDITAPTAPSSVALTSGASLDNNTTPSLDVGGLAVNDTVKVYSDSLCVTEVSSMTATSSVQTLTVTPALTLSGTYYFYAKAIDAYGNASGCSSAFATYDLDITPPAAPDSLSLITPGSSPGNIAAPMIQVSTVSNNDSVKLYLESSCTTVVGAETASGNSVIISSSTLASAGTYTYYATATDLAGNMSACSSTSLTYVYDNVSPAVTDVTSSNTDKKFGPGATISVQMTWSEAVTVSGSPTLMLNTSPTQYATYTSGSGTNTLTFTYTVALGDAQTDLNYDSTSSLSLNSGFIKDAALNNASLLLPGTSASGALGVNKDIMIMPNPPKVSLAGSPTVRLNEGDSPQTYQVDLDYDAHYNITVHLADYSAMIAGSDYILSTNNVVIPAGSLSQTFTVSFTNDAVANGFRRLRLAIDNINGAFPGLLNKISQKEIYVRDDDSAGLDAISLAQGYGSNHTCVLKTGGVPACWGAGSSYQLGDGATANRFIPQAPTGMASGSYYNLTTGANHTCVLTSANNAKCWGKNTSGQLGDNSTNDRSAPYQISLDTYSKIAAGENYTCAISDVESRLYCWGLNTNCQLGDGTNTPKNYATEIDYGVFYAYVAPGSQTTCGITTAGVLKCWGLNSSGQVGVGTTNTPYQTPVVVDSGTAYSKVAVGMNHACGITQGGALKCWGSNTYGQLGDGSGLQKLVPTSIIASGVIDIALGAVHSCALLSSGDMKCWGENSTGQLGDGTTTNRGSPVSVATGVVSIMAGNAHTCAMAANGETKCWGYNNYSQLGATDAYVKTAALVGSNFASIATGKYHACGLTVSGAVRCWGENIYGEVGDGTLYPRTSPVQIIESGVVQIASGEYFSCAVFASGKLQCWGSNSDGRLGDGNTSSRRLRPYDIIASGVLEVDLGTNSACARLANGSVQCWGYNGSAGKVGNNSIAQQNAPIEVLDSSFGAIALSVSSTHACALNNAGILYCWGDNSYGQFGIGSIPTGSMVPLSTSLNFNQISAGSNYTCGIVSGALKCWGYNSSKQLGDGTTTPRNTPVAIDSGVAYSQISTGASHTCGVTIAGSLKCWGSNANSQLGTITPSGPTEMVSSGVAQVSSADYNTCYRLSSNEVKCLGTNNAGAVGNGDLTLLRLPLHVFGL